MRAPTRLLARLLALSIAFACAGVLAACAAAVLDLCSFELRPLFELLGCRGLVLLAAVLFTCVVGFVGAVQVYRGRALSRWMKATAIAGAALAAWVLQYLLLETPVTVRVWQGLHRVDSVQPDEPLTEDFRDFSLVAPVTDPEVRARLGTMYRRIQVNSPESYGRHPVGRTIDQNARRYSSDPVVIFFRAYLNSFWGEAVAGPLPFARSMTAETVRDLIQIRLPASFVEASWRRHLIESGVLQRLFGARAGFKLRYALHKATLDVSSQPYDLNTFSDVFMILDLHPEEFRDLFDAAETDPLRRALVDSFQRLSGALLPRPCDAAYEPSPLDQSYYSASREDLKRFARAAYYLTATDFDFATRVQSLLVVHHSQRYRDLLGADRWSALPEWQRQVMLTMIRDLYTPNVGRLGYNLYALPELNCTPVRYVAGEATRMLGALGGRLERVWLPRHPEYLWAGAGYQLRVLNEVRTLVTGQSIPGLGLESSETDARRVLRRLERPR